MAQNSPKVRLFVEAPLMAGAALTLSDQAHYIANVMRMDDGDRIGLFNGADGEWAARLVRVSKKSVDVLCEDQIGQQEIVPDVWLLFAPIKKARTDFIVEKATELGVARMTPVQTDFTNAERVRQDRLRAHAVEAAEQCGGTSVPLIDPLKKLDAVLADWPDDRQLLFCDEALGSGGMAKFSDLPRGKWAILIGPEGGFSDRERNELRARRDVTSVGLGARILRADTAVVAALTLWHSALDTPT